MVKPIQLTEIQKDNDNGLAGQEANNMDNNESKTEYPNTFSTVSNGNATPEHPEGSSEKEIAAADQASSTMVDTDLNGVSVQTLCLRRKLNVVSHGTES